ncbi:MAG: crossover junction endodeoxyribonuclease RuvC [Chlamydiia bacterium]|nr:crossover junction endodeoxyribonuclease RuvC [Chlamydiia bacterium]
MILLGIDPGTAVTGWGVIQVENQTHEALDFGAIRPARAMKLSDRYHVIFQAVKALIEKFSPEAIAIETQFTHKNMQSALKLAMCRGVVIVAAKDAGIPIFEYAPTKIKKAVTGRGSADKSQVKGMIRHLLHLSEDPTPEDAADALACAICHAHAARFSELITNEV